MRAQFPRLRVDDLEFFLDADGEAVRHDPASGSFTGLQAESS
jgi:hypothetical protein